MRIIEPSFEILDEVNGKEILKRIERTGRTCYKSEEKITDDSAVEFVKKLVARKHFPMLDHESISVRIICDRGVTHEIVRHRIAAYAQESTRCCNYSKEIFGGHLTFIKPCFFPEIPLGTFTSKDCEDNINPLNLSVGVMRWLNGMLHSEFYYLEMIAYGCSPQEARSVLPNSLKTEIVCNIRFDSMATFFQTKDGERSPSTNEGNSQTNVGCVQGNGSSSF